MFGTQVIVTGKVSAISSRLAAHRPGHELLEKRADPWANVLARADKCRRRLRGGVNPGVASEAFPHGPESGVHQKGSLLRFCLGSIVVGFRAELFSGEQGPAPLSWGKSTPRSGFS